MSDNSHTTIKQCGLILVIGIALVVGFTMGKKQRPDVDSDVPDKPFFQSLKDKGFCFGRIVDWPDTWAANGNSRLLVKVTHGNQTIVIPVWVVGTPPPKHCYPTRVVPAQPCKFPELEGKAVYIGIQAHTSDGIIAGWISELEHVP